MHDSNLARQISDIEAKIAEIEMQIVQRQKRIENLLAKGADTSEQQAAIAGLKTTLAQLEASKVELEGRES